jgi:hypothetical protein
VDQYFKELSMHDFLVGLAFIGMVICPAVVATFSRKGGDEDEA